MLERGRAPVKSAARFDPDEELHPRRVRRVTDRLERSVVPVRIRAPVAGHGPPVTFEHRIGGDGTRSVPSGVEPVDVQRDPVLFSLLDDVEMLLRRNPSPHDSGNRRLDQFSVGTRRVMLKDKPPEHVLSVQHLSLPVEGQVQGRAGRFAGMEDRAEVLDAGQNRRMPAPLMIEVGSPCAAPAESGDEPVAAGLVVEERKPYGARASIPGEVVGVCLSPGCVAGSIHRDPTALVPHRVVHRLAHEVEIVLVARRADRAMQDRHRAVGCMPIGIDSPEIVDLCRIGLSVVPDADDPLEGGEAPELGEHHLAVKRGLVVPPAQGVRACPVVLPVSRLDGRSPDSHPLPAASFAASEREGDVGDIPRFVRPALPEEELLPLGHERHLAGRRL